LIRRAGPAGSAPTVELELGTSVVFVDGPGGGPDADEVVLDNAAGARMAVVRPTLVPRGSGEIRPAGRS